MAIELFLIQSLLCCCFLVPVGAVVTLQDCGSLDCVISRVVRESDLRSVCFSPSDSKAIVDGNLKLILGLIWTLILHYSISMPAWEGEDEEVTSGLVLLTSVHLKTPQDKKKQTFYDETFVRNQRENGEQNKYLTDCMRALFSFLFFPVGVKDT